MLSKKFARPIMKYIGQTKLPHGVVMHYSNSRGNLESCFIENDSSSTIFID
ncbi:MAG: hypothetical protein HRU07_02380 [Nitrosopumilus sp.]|nr:hypothetical protein [Nitrosopumilus sp.]NRA05019.1 hypothetical protein [Nitrosopumilus sp.]